MIKKLLLILLFLFLFTSNTYANSMCSNHTTSLIQLKTKYTDKIINLKPNTRIYNNGRICKKLKKKENLELVIWLYDDETMEEEGVYSLSLLTAIIDIKRNIIVSSNFFENIAESDATAIGNIFIDIDSYNLISENNIFSIEIKFEGSSNPNPYIKKIVYVYEDYKGNIRKIINQLKVFEFSGEWDTNCNGLFKIFEKKEITFKGTSEYPLIQISLSNKEKKQVLSKDSSFCLKTIKHYPTIVENLVFDGKKYVNFGNKYKLDSLIHAMSFTKKNLTPYNNIAYYLQEAGANEEAVFLLKKIIAKFPNRTVAYYNLGDAYWALGNKEKARKAYTTYIEQMCDKGLQKKIPKVVMKRIESK